MDQAGEEKAATGGGKPRRRIWRWVGVGFGVFVLLVIIAAASPSGRKGFEEGQQAAREGQETPETTTQTSPQTIIPTATPSTEGLLVKSVIDGDTIELEDGTKIRYIGIDTPESVHPSKPVECFGKEAATKNEELVGGKRVRLEKDISETDRYDRLLRYAYVGDLFVNDFLVRQGYANAVSFPPDVRYLEQFRQAEREARESKRGLWSSCPLEQSTSATTPPAVSITQGASSGGVCNIKGNISSSGEKIYHLPGCGSYDKTVISEDKGERYFCSEAEAVAASWRKAKNCP